MGNGIRYVIVKSGDRYALRLINPHGCSHNCADKSHADINGGNDHELDN